MEDFGDFSTKIVDISAILVHNSIMKITDQYIKTLLPGNFIKRQIHDTLMNSIRNPEVTILYGARQVGKSSELYNCIHEVLTNKPSSDVFYYNLDYPTDEFQNPEYFLNSVNAQRLNLDQIAYIFIDEAQRLENVGVFIKYIYDQKRNVKFILSGSASLDIKEKIKEPLTGRKEEIYLSALNLTEILNYRGINVETIQGYFPQLKTILEEYLLYGGYPGVVTEATLERKVSKLKEISESYIYRDITNLFKIENINHVKLVASYLSENIGNLLSKDNIAKVGQLTKYQVERVLDALERTFVIDLIYPFAKNNIKEITSRPKVFFTDPGIRNAIAGKVNEFNIINDKGKLFENALEIHLKDFVRRQTNGELLFWRTLNQTEIDFILKLMVEGEPPQLIAYEAKYTWNSDQKPRSLQSFEEIYKNKINISKVITSENYWELLNDIVK